MRSVKRNDLPVTFWVADDSWEDEFFTVNHDAGVRHLNGFCGACLLGVSKKESYICRSCECRVDTD
ncbi:hypothetical protein KKG46_02530 [Patescibacteria group bacterium]|nr:hypothetical protein [Patescibacteria group bacterium]